MKKLFSILLLLVIVIGCAVLPLTEAGATTCDGVSHTPVITEGYPAFCGQEGRKDGQICSVCGTVLLEQEIIPALSHDIEQHEAKIPTYSSVGWEAYENCTRCSYTTYVEIPALETPSVETYEDFLMNLSLLEEIAYLYVQENPGKDPANLVIKYIRTGVDRYNSGSWGIMAGYEDAGFAKFVSEMEDMINSEMTDISEMICITSLKDIKNFQVPNGDYVDFGHMFGTMDITYHNNFSVNHADVAGWAGDLVDLLSTADRHAVSGTLDEMVADIAENYLNKSLNESDTFGLTDMYGDLDGLYVMKTLQGMDYEYGTLTTIIMEYFTEELTDEDRAEFFLQNRLDGVSTRGDVRDAVYHAYTSNKVIATLEGTREFTSDNLEELKKACCYAFADYVCKLAGDFVDVVENPYYSVFSSTSSVLAPGITQKIEMATSADGKQMVYYLATADLRRDDVHIFANYNNNNPAAGWAMQRVLDQAKAAQAKYGDPDSPFYVPNYNVIASVNGAGFNMSTGEPSGLLIMNGVVYQDINASGFFGILKDGTAVIGTKEEYLTIYKDQVAEGIAGFGTTLVENGEVCITRTDNYYTDRASRTAVGITKTGKVVFMVLDGRQEPWSCGGSMQEIAQIMLEAGCVHAINLDGGGSTTFVAKQEGADELSVVNRPSDGMERSVSTSLLMVSTAPSSTAFDHAILNTPTDYITVGGEMQVTPSGVSATGNAAELPEGATWAVSNTRWGTITEDGKFTALRNGDVDVYLKLGDEIIGSKTIHIVIPSQVYFVKKNINAVFGQSIELPIKALYEGKEVTIRHADVLFTMNNSAAGVMDGFSFIGDEASGIKVVVITATLANNEEASASITLNLFRQGENSFDFDQATGGDREFAWDREVSNATTDDAITYTVVDKTKDMVTSYVFAIDMTQIPIPQRLEDLIYMLPGSDMEGASAWGFLLQLAERVSAMSEVKPVIRFDPNVKVDYSELKLVNEYFTLTNTEFDEATNTLTLTLNWIKQSQPIDQTMANPLCLVNGIKVTPKEDAPWDSKSQLTVVNSGEISYKIYLRASGLYSFTQKPENQEIYGLYPYENPDDAKDKGGCFGDIYHTFEDTYTLVNTPKHGWIIEDGGFAYYNEGDQYFGIHKVDGLYYNFGENGINTGKTPYSGLFDENGKTYYAKNGELVNGWQAIGDEWYLFSWSTYAGVDGPLSVTIEGVVATYELDNGHVVKGYWQESAQGLRYFYGPYYYKSGMRKIAGETYYFEDGYAATGIYPVQGAHAIKPTWHEFTETGVLIGLAADGLYWHEGKLYYVVNADSDHYGFYYVDGAYYCFNGSAGARLNQSCWVSRTNNLLPAGTYRFGADGKVIMTTELVNENGTLYYYKNGKRAGGEGLISWEGELYYIDGGARAVVDTRLWVSKTNGLMPQGSYNFDAEGKLVLNNGIVDGYYYVNGVKTSAGLIQVDGDYYYAGYNGKIVTSQSYWISTTNNLLPAGTYRFGADGKIIMTTEIVNEDGTLYFYKDGKRAGGAGLISYNGALYYIDGAAKAAVNTKVWVSNTNGLMPKDSYSFDAEGKMILHNGIVDGYYYVNGVKTSAGLVLVDGNYYYAEYNGKLITGRTYWITRTNNLLTAGTYRFEADGKITMTTEIVNENGTLYYYKNGRRTGGAGLISWNGDMYFIDGGARAAVNTKIWVENTNGLVPKGSYTFDAEGKMVIYNGIVDGYYYVNGVKTAVGLIQVDGDYYYTTYNGKLVTSQNFWISTTNGLLTAGTYRFDADGKIIMTTEIVNENGTLYYYKNGRRAGGAGLISWNGDMYFIDGGAKAAVNTKVWVNNTNGLVPKGSYTFDAEGKMVIYNGIVDGYYYVDGVKTAVGLIQVDGDYYYTTYNGKLVTSQSFWISTTNGLLTAGTYRFDADGKIIMTTEIVNEDGTLYYYKNGMRTGNAGLISYNGALYYIDGGAKAAVNTKVWVSNTNGLMPEGSYNFDAEGKLVLNNGVVDGYYYVDGVKTSAGLILWEDNYYYAGYNGILVTNQSYWISTTNGLLTAGTYRFDADGKIIMTTDLVNEDGTLYYYKDGKRAGNAGVISWNGDLYYIDGGAKAAVDTKIWVSNTNGLVPEGSYSFDADGKMII